jgi:hypothetical protein
LHVGVERDDGPRLELGSGLEEPLSDEVPGAEVGVDGLVPTVAD